MKKKFFILLILLFFLWLGLLITDFIRVNHFEKPLFALATETADDGGSGKYIGLGYSFHIKGNFLPEDEFPGVTSFTAYIFGIEIANGVRD
ncbi:MAG: hypothetical protein IJ405_05700 [Lachnospiraceae bacterium]|nr:hypothetical protein [Lachnospiraceae bacterium]MBQ7781504.1 hypothetical protein [Lachnospiraceae bacterium]